MKCPHCGAELPNIKKLKAKPLKARIKATGEQVEILDYGEKFVPRYWTDTTGYYSEQLEFPAKPQVQEWTPDKGAKLNGYHRQLCNTCHKPFLSTRACCTHCGSTNVQVGAKQPQE